MDKIVGKLKRKSTITGNDFNYSIHPERKQSFDYPQIILNAKTTQRQNHQINFIEPVPRRRPNRFHTSGLQVSIEPEKIITIHRSSQKKDALHIPIEFSVSVMNSPVKVFTPKSHESYSNHSFNQEKALTPKIDLNLKIFEENKEISEISSSQEISVHEYQRRGPNRLSKTGSFMLGDDKSDASILNNSPDKGQFKDVTTTDMKSGQTLETDKIQELKPVGLSLMRSRITPSQTHADYLNFNQALKMFYLSNEVYIEAHLWIKSFFDYVCCCFLSNDELAPENLEVCEKVIIFAYNGFDSSNIFHSSLLVSVYNSLQKLIGESAEWIEVGFSSNDPHEKDLNHNIAPMGLMFILFLNEYIPNTLETMIKYCKELGIAFVPIAFDIAEIAIITLRKKKLNQIIHLTQKCLETLCFFFAGCLAEWFSLYKDLHTNIKKINEIIESKAFKEPTSFINLAKNLLIVQNFEAIN